MYCELRKVVVLPSGSRFIGRLTPFEGHSLLEGILHPEDLAVRLEKTSIGLSYFLMAPLLEIVVLFFCHVPCYM